MLEVVDLVFGRQLSVSQLQGGVIPSPWLSPTVYRLSYWEVPPGIEAVTDSFQTGMCLELQRTDYFLVFTPFSQSRVKGLNDVVFGAGVDVEAAVLLGSLLDRQQATGITSEFVSSRIQGLEPLDIVVFHGNWLLCSL